MITTGFEPAKRIAGDLKSPSFDRTWIRYLVLLTIGQLKGVFKSLLLVNNTHDGDRTHDNRDISTVLYLTELREHLLVSVKILLNICC